MEKVMRWGRRMQIVSIALAALIPAAFLYVLWSHSLGDLVPLPTSVRLDPASLSTGDRLLVGLLGLPKPIVYLICLWCLYRLFGLYRRGVVFEREATRWLIRVGYALIAFDFAAMMQAALAGPVLTLAGVTPPFLSIQLRISYLIIGLFVLVIAHVMDIARAINEEQQLTI